MKRIFFIIILLFFATIFLFKYCCLYKEDEIRLGMSAALTGDMRQLGVDFYKGANAYFNSLNENGGVYGRKIKLIIKDDKYEPKITEENIKQLIQKEKIFALFGIVGTPTAKVALEIATESKIPMLATLSGAMFLREPRNPMILNVRKGYNSEIKAFLNYLIDEKGHKRIAAFYQNDSFGHTALYSLKKLLKERNMQLVGEGSYKRNTLAVGHAIYELKGANPDVIIMIGAAKPTVEFIRRSLNTSLGEATKAILSFASAQTMMRELECTATNLLFAQVVPLPWGDNEDVVEYRANMARYYPETEIGFASLEGYIAGVMVGSIFEHLGPKFSKDSFIDKLHDVPKEIFHDKSIVIKDNGCGCLDKVYITKYNGYEFEVIKEYSDE
ncbi:MAG: ABC transporter substrate-binding protein [Campylobacterales bacterium]|jgi:branched-chain amino acid transport system substrate-binding protein|nr:ABC transporter substrate-binding protein [Campylobacterales bacterium]